jgi:hypothetical protein
VWCMMRSVRFLTPPCISLHLLTSPHITPHLLASPQSHLLTRIPHSIASPQSHLLTRVSSQVVEDSQHVLVVLELILEQVYIYSRWIHPHSPIHSSHTPSHTLLSYTPLIRSSHTLLPYTPLIQYTLLPYTLPYARNTSPSCSRPTALIAVERWCDRCY